ncbi:ABC transporter permease [Acidimangrovimonas sediminis]|uniref:ABC transporter permease n=1 Tax=Acidimangrovimonas sediminis TaxID=2056283 RepID=UPI000C809854|nr:ABC transporter permease [Acidimangrovimonas sediminis]
MLRYTLKRLAAGAAMLIALSMLVFILLRLAPGDPVDAYIDPMVKMSAADMARLRAELGLDKPLPVQYLIWLRDVLHGDFGRSLQRTGEPVLALIGSRIGPTLLLMLSGFGIAIIFGLIAGVVSAVKRGSVRDGTLLAVAAVGVSSPAFLTALIGLYLFSVVLHWAPSGGMLTPAMPFSLHDLLSHLILPALILAFYQSALVTRYMRSSMLEVLTQDYIRTARAKGVRENRIVSHHAVRNALLPVVTLIGSTLGLAVGGAIFIESVFNWPGMGLLLVNAVELRDYPVIMGSTLVIGAWVIVMNIATDLVYAVIDPRVKVS